MSEADTRFRGPGARGAPPERQGTPARPDDRHRSGAGRRILVKLGGRVQQDPALPAAIDNLVKGAAGQALQNANLLLGLAETAGLPR